jgi:hypothetical protein
MPALTLSPPTPPPNHLTPRLIQTFCTMRAERVAREVHAYTRIPLRERQLVSLENRMLETALGATSDDDVTARVDAAQDAFAESIAYRTPRMWKHCRTTATLLVMRISLVAMKGIGWRAHMVRVMTQRMFRSVVGARDDEEVNRRLKAVYDAALLMYGASMD